MVEMVRMLSYDVDLAGTCVWHNMTSNVAPMWRHAGIDISEWQDKRAHEVIDALKQAIDSMQSDPETYRAMNPSNGWGSYETCLEFLQELYVDFRTYPNSRIEVSY